MLAQCLTLTTPYVDPEGRPQKTFDNVLANRVTALRDQHYSLHGSSYATALIDALLDRDAGRRLGMELRLQPFFWGLDLAELQRREVTPPHAAYSRERAQDVEASFAAVCHDAQQGPLPGVVSLTNDFPGW